ncbi:hypothetical protein IEQ34_015573 [Dendrobium chrysotoxum]|uniref:Uncharacterized protein n=1 Tax=Dendrobium chrysotoxum TaxID=161865 RepID=A0AAV7GHI3_DENCH|nr:hypothetical protein IEQ34_015573 [Dendrobium chrysotoxum]
MKKISGKDEFKGYLVRLGSKIVMQYDAKFIALIRYVPQLINIVEEKCYRFFRGLRDEIQHPLVPLRIQEFFELVERAKLVENDLKVPAFRHNMSRKRSRDHMTKADNNKMLGNLFDSRRGPKIVVGSVPDVPNMAGSILDSIV